MPSAQTLSSALETLLEKRPHAPDEIATLVRVGSLLNSTLDLGEVLRLAMEEAANAMHAEASSILLVEEKTGDLVFEVATGAKGDETRRVRLRPSEGIAGWVVAHGTPARVDDAQQDPRFTTRVDRNTNLVTRSVLCVPLKVKDRMIGVLEVINKRGEQPFTDRDQEFLTLLSHLIATAVDNAQLYRKVYEEKETLRAVLDGMADGVLVVDTDDRILLHNRAILDLLDVAAAEICLEKLDDPRVSGLANRLAREERSTVSFNLEYHRHEEPTTLANTAAVLRDPSGGVVGAVMVLRNITELARVDRMKNDFISATSHKLRTPLTSILGFASILRNEKLRNTTGENAGELVGSAAAAIEEQGRYLRSLIEKLLNFTGMELDNFRLEKEPVEVSLLIEEAVQVVRSWAEAKGIRLAGGSELLAAEAYVDRRKMVQVLANLLENAIKFSPPGTTVTIGAEGAEDRLCFWVSDQGPGIAREEQERIFEKFYQVDRDLTGQVEGAGLGLALCRNVVSAHGGSITVESARGSGSTFSVDLPVA